MKILDTHTDTGTYAWTYIPLPRLARLRAHENTHTRTRTHTHTHAHTHTHTNTRTKTPGGCKNGTFRPKTANGAPAAALNLQVPPASFRPASPLTIMGAPAYLHRCHDVCHHAQLRLCADSLRVACSVQTMPLFGFFSGRNQVSMRCLSGIVVRRRATCLRDSDASDHLTGSRRAKATSLVGSAARSTTQTSPSALPWVTSHLAPRQSGRRDSSWTPSATASRMRSKARSLRRCLPVRIRQ